MDHTHSNLPGWLPEARPFAVTGTACIIAGGLIAAVTAHDPTRHGMWVVAYLVLVGGIAQGGLGLGQAFFGESPPDRRRLVVEYSGVNLGNACVIAGTLLARPWLVDIGGAMLAAALVLFLLGVRGVPARVPVILYRALIVVVLGSIPVGLVLARL